MVAVVIASAHASGTAIALYKIAEGDNRGREVGTMGFAILIIAYVVLALIGSVGLHAGHA